MERGRFDPGKFWAETVMFDPIFPEEGLIVQVGAGAVTVTVQVAF